jgi:hypothetical protein
MQGGKWSAKDNERDHGSQTATSEYLSDEGGKYGTRPTPLQYPLAPPRITESGSFSYSVPSPHLVTTVAATAGKKNSRLIPATRCRHQNIKDLQETVVLKAES